MDNGTKYHCNISLHTKNDRGKSIIEFPLIVKDYDCYNKEVLYNLKHHINDNKLKYICIKRMMFNNGYRYYAQLVIDGLPPFKHIIGNGPCGIDIGVSSVAATTQSKCLLEDLAPKSKEYSDKAIKYQKLMERSLRLNNKENYNNDGTIKKGSKFKKTKTYKKYNRLYKTILRKAKSNSLETKCKIANDIIAHSDNITYELMNFKALQKKTKDKFDNDGNIIIERSEKITIIKDKQVHKCKKKKRFGKILKNKSPATFLEILKYKCNFLNIPINSINTQTYKASQYNHLTNECNKKALNERWNYLKIKTRDDEIILKIQRDLYSSFLIAYPNKDYTLPDREKCLTAFNTFIKNHNECIKIIKATQSKRLSCFGF